MKLDELANNLRRDLLDLFSLERIRPTPQVIASIVESIIRSSQETLGDSDSVLAGLLYSGSYVVDLLEIAGANPRKLRTLADRSAKYMPDFEEEDLNDEVDRCGDGVVYLTKNIARAPILQHAIELARSSNRVLETAHLLSSLFLETEFLGFSFPFHLRKDKRSSTMLHHWLEYEMAELLFYGAAVLADPKLNRTFLLFGDSDFPGRDMISRRRHPISKQEDALLDRFLGIYHQNLDINELEFVIAALNAWFEHRRILTEPQSLCIKTLHDCDIMAIAPELIYESGGNFQAVENGLQVANRFSPERDLAGLALFERQGRIHIGQYTYRNTFCVDTEISTGYPIRRVGLQAVRPASLLSVNVIDCLEGILSRENLNELEIQDFLVKHPEILQALGYAAIKAHVCLYAENKEQLIPDFILEIPSGGFDILDLKLPSARLLVRKPHVHMSNQLVKAIGQLRKYAKFFENARNRKEFIRRYGMEPFKPELIAVIGRNDEFRSKDERFEIEEQVGRIRLLTYDDLIAYGRTRSIIIPRQI